MTFLDVYKWDGEIWEPVYHDSYHVISASIEKEKAIACDNAEAIFLFLENSFLFEKEKFRVMTEGFDMTTHDSEDFGDDDEDSAALCST